MSCFRVFCSEEKRAIAERIQQEVDEEATKRVLRTFQNEKIE